MARKLASIQRISDIQPIEGADLIVCASVLGWKLVVKKGEFNVGDLCVYCEVDSLLPASNENFAFLEKAKYRIKTVKLRGQISQGICFPMSILPEAGVYCTGDDVTDILGIVKYELPLSRGALSGDTKGSFPGYLIQTDETRIQSVPELLEELSGVECRSTLKVDGTSATFSLRNGEYDVCSRGRSLKDNGTSIYWRMSRKYDIFEALTHSGENLAIQAEIAGFWDPQCRMRIQANRLGLKETEIFVFDVFDIDNYRYYTPDELVRFCDYYRLPMAPVLGDFVLDHSVDELLEMSKGEYPGGGPREGIVIRPLDGRHSEILQSRASFKVINNEFLLKNGE